MCGLTSSVRTATSGSVTSKPQSPAPRLRSRLPTGRSSCTRRRPPISRCQSATSGRSSIPAIQVTPPRPTRCSSRSLPPAAPSVSRWTTAGCGPATFADWEVGHLLAVPRSERSVGPPSPPRSGVANYRSGDAARCRGPAPPCTVSPLLLFFYCAAGNGTPRIDTDRDRRCAKAQLSGTIRYKPRRAGSLTNGLITRRSQVQILPPPPTEVQVRGPFRRRRGPLCLSLESLATVTTARSALPRHTDVPIIPTNSGPSQADFLTHVMSRSG